MNYRIFVALNSKECDSISRKQKFIENLLSSKTFEGHTFLRLDNSYSIFWIINRCYTKDFPESRNPVMGGDPIMMTLGKINTQMIVKLENEEYMMPKYISPQKVGEIAKMLECISISELGSFYLQFLSDESNRGHVLRGKSNDVLWAEEQVRLKQLIDYYALSAKRKDALLNCTCGIASEGMKNTSFWKRI